MLNRNHSTPAAALAAGLFMLAFPAPAFEGRITATSTQGGDTVVLLYTVGTNALRLEVTGSDRPNPVDVLDLQTGTLTLFFPHNRRFVRLKSDSGGAHTSARVLAERLVRRCWARDAPNRTRAGRALRAARWLAPRGRHAAASPGRCRHVCHARDANDADAKRDDGNQGYRPENQSAGTGVRAV